MLGDSVVIVILVIIAIVCNFLAAVYFFDSLIKYSIVKKLNKEK